MHRTFAVSLIAAGFAAGVVAWLQPSDSVAAGSGGGGDPTSVATLDSDGDFLPDAVEWVVLTDAHSADTDGDEVPDFIEVVSAANPRKENPAVPLDHQMRLVITGPQPGCADPRTWMHVFHRVLGPSGPAASIQSFDTWLERPEWPGLRIPLNAFAAGGVVYKERIVPGEGSWVQFSIPLVSQQILTMVLPCTIWAESVVSGQTYASGMQLVPVPEGVASIVPWDVGRFVLQTLSPVPTTTPPAGLFTETNRVCVMDMQEQSSGPAGTTYVVTHAECEDANELECASNCPDSVGWTVTIPGGTGLIGGQ